MFVYLHVIDYVVELLERDLLTVKEKSEVGLDELETSTDRILVFEAVVFKYFHYS